MMGEASENVSVSRRPTREVIMNGTIVDFLNLATEKPELAKALVEVAA